MRPFLSATHFTRWAESKHPRSSGIKRASIKKVGIKSKHWTEGGFFLENRGWLRIRTLALIRRYTDHASASVISTAAWQPAGSGRAQRHATRCSSRISTHLAAASGWPVALVDRSNTSVVLGSVSSNRWCARWSTILGQSSANSRGGKFSEWVGVYAPPSPCNELQRLFCPPLSILIGLYLKKIYLDWRRRRHWPPPPSASQQRSGLFCWRKKSTSRL